MIGEILDYSFIFQQQFNPFEQYVYFCPVCSVKQVGIKT